MSKVLIHNAAVVDPSGERVVLFGGDRLPEWADGQVSPVLYRVVEDELEPEPEFAKGGRISGPIEVTNTECPSRVLPAPIDAYGYPAPEPDES